MGVFANLVGSGCADCHHDDMWESARRGGGRQNSSEDFFLPPSPIIPCPPTLESPDIAPFAPGVRLPQHRCLETPSLGGSLILLAEREKAPVPLSPLVLLLSTSPPGIRHSLISKASRRSAGESLARPSARDVDHEAAAECGRGRSAAADGPDKGDGHAACRARAGDLESRLAASEAASSELRAANEALEAALASSEAEKGELRARLAAFGAGSSSVSRRSAVWPVEVEVCPFLARRRDFGAELPAGVLLALMDRAPSSKCVFPLNSPRGRHVPLSHFLRRTFESFKGAVWRTCRTVAPLSLSETLTRQFVA